MARLALAALSPSERSELLRESAPAQERIIPRLETAQRFNRTPRTVDHWAASGLLHKVKLPGAARAVGFRLSEVESLLRGEGK